jgi:hypothetical protein
MAANHFIVPSMPLPDVTTVRLGAGNLAAQRLTDVDAGKLAKLVGESRYAFTVAGDPIEGIIVAVENGTSNGYSVGGIVNEDKFFATADGLQATPGTGTLAVGDFVVTGTVVPLNVAMPGFAKVCKATSQALALFMWRVVSLGTVGTGAVGTIIVIERTV